jgi:hypothetical protein
MLFDKSQHIFALVSNATQPNERQETPAFRAGSPEGEGARLNAQALGNFFRLHQTRHHNSRF